MEKFDLVVIGAGPGGYPCAIRAAQLGASVAVIEREELGGTCLNWGCIPTKTLLASSELYHRAKGAAALGLKPGRIGFDYEAMIARKDAVVARLTGGIAGLLKSHGVTHIQGTARIEGHHRISVRNGEDLEWLEAAKIVVATGAESVVPRFLPRSPRIVESRRFLEMTKLPKRLIVLGGGVIGCEFACMAAQLGASVTVVEMLDDILMVLDPDIRRVLRRHMSKELGMEILTGAALSDVTTDEKDVTGTVGEATVKGDLMLVSIGRRPCTADLGLENVGIPLNDNGTLNVDAQGRTAVAGIFAIGDITAGSTQLAHAATAEGVAVAQTAVAGKPSTADPLVPACIFTSPEVGVTGLSEMEAKAAGRDVKTSVFHFAALGKAMAAGDTTGFVKWVIDPATDQLLGAAAVGPHATELISEATVAIRNELTAEELGNTIHCHPTLSEAWMEAAHAAHGTCVHQPARKKRR